jgi:hypothetical protein
MAEFSKQWAELNGETGCWDFDIEEIASSIPNNHHTQCICEGFGFVEIGKNDIGEIILGYRNWKTNDDDVDYKHLSDVIKEQKNKI